MEGVSKETAIIVMKGTISPSPALSETLDSAPTDGKLA